MLKIKKRCNQIILKTKNPIKFNKKLIQLIELLNIQFLSIWIYINNDIFFLNNKWQKQIKHLNFFNAMNT